MKAIITVVKDDKMWEKIKKDLLAANKVGELEVGFWPEDRYGPENDNLPVAQVAQWNNEGMGVPARPFFTQTLREPIKNGEKDHVFFKSLDRILSGKSTFLTEYTLIGKQFSEELRKSIFVWSIPPNAPLTVELKGFNNPLIETGLMMDSVKYKIGGR
jgi:hypothetical protein